MRLTVDTDGNIRAARRDEPQAVSISIILAALPVILAILKSAGIIKDESAVQLIENVLALLALLNPEGE